MNTASLFDFNGHGFFVWSSYGMLLLAVLAELFFLRRQRRRALSQARQLTHEAPARRARVQETSPDTASS